MSKQEKKSQPLEAKLMAAMTSADGRVLDIENLVASAMIDNIGDKSADDMWDKYEENLNVVPSREKLIEVLQPFKDQTLEERIDILKMLSVIAIADGEVHSRERALIELASATLNVPLETVSKNIRLAPL